MHEHRFSISSEELRDECMRRKYCELLAKAEVFPSKENWDYIIGKKMSGLGSGLYRKYLVSCMLDENERCDFHELAIKRFPNYLKTVERSYAIETVYSDIASAPDATRTLIFDCELFDSEKICEIFDKGNTDFAISLLRAYQPLYDGDAIDAMNYLLEKITSLPNIGSIEQRKGIFRTENLYICPDGHSNPADAIYCKCSGCGKDIKGLTEQQRSEIEDFKQRITILRDMLD